MLRKIASNSYYDVMVDPAKNRMHLTIKGFWQTRELVPHYVADIGEAISMLTPRFSVVLNLTRMVSPTQEVSILHNEVQELLVKGGLIRSAEIVNDPLMVNSVEKYSARPGMTRRAFYDPGFAEVWLDSFDE